MKKTDILIAKLKAKQKVRKAKEFMNEKKGMVQNATQPQPQPAPTAAPAPDEPNGLGNDNGLGIQP
jgi:hypothetical protein